MLAGVVDARGARLVDRAADDAGSPGPDEPGRGRDGRGDHRVRCREAAGRRRDRGGRLRRPARRARDVRPAPPVAGRAVARPAPGPPRVPGAARQRRQLRRPRRGAPRRRPGCGVRPDDHDGHRHRRGRAARRRGPARRQRHGRGVRAHAGRAGRAGVRVREERVLGAVLLGQRAGPQRPGTDGRAAVGAGRDERREAGAGDRPDGHLGRRGGRPRRPSGLRLRRRLARGRHGQPRGRARPAGGGHRRRCVGRRRQAARPGARRAATYARGRGAPSGPRPGRGQPRAAAPA